MTKAATVKDYLNSLDEERRDALETLRKVINKNIDKKFSEGIQYGHVAWFVPHSVYPDGYHCDPKQPLPFASIASQKRHIGIYLFCIYMNEDLQKSFVADWKASGKKLDMGKACIRVKSIDDVPLDVLGAFFKKIKTKDFVAHYEAMREQGSKRAPKKAAKKKATKKKASTKKATKKKATKKTASKKTPAKRKAAAKKSAPKKSNTSAKTKKSTPAKKKTASKRTRKP